MINDFIKKYLKPFWFSKNCERIKVPYVYGSFLQVAFFVAVVMFLRMAWLQYDAGVLAATAGTIATLAGLYFGVLKLYENRKP